MPPILGGWRRYRFDDTYVSAPDVPVSDWKKSDFRIACVPMPNALADYTKAAVGSSGESAACMYRGTMGLPTRGTQSLRVWDAQNSFTGDLYNDNYGYQRWGNADTVVHQEYCSGSQNLAEFLAQPGCYLARTTST